MTQRSLSPSISDKIYGAANSYHGFKSNFDKLFNPENYTKIFIIKGGSGTGKSTLMRQISDYGKKQGKSVTQVYCSSDPNSLDGVIICDEKRKVAVLDGTAPHTTDPLYPGAKEEIINVGDGFDIQKLEESSDTIIRLCKDKSRHYKSAYSLLCAAGYVSECIWNNIAVNESYFEAENDTSEIFSKLKAERRAEHTTQNYIASFSKHGYMKLPLDPKGRAVINITGDPLSCYLLMDKIKKQAEYLSVAEEICPSPLDGNFTDRVYTPSTVFTVNEGERSDISLPPIKKGELLDDEFNLLKELLSGAVNRLAKAADGHFAVEKIYSGCIDFSNNDRLLKQITARMDRIFG